MSENALEAWRPSTALTVAPGRASVRPATAPSMTESPMAVTLCPSGRGRSAGAGDAGGDALGAGGVTVGLTVAVIGLDDAGGTERAAVWASGVLCKLDEVTVRDFPCAGWPPIW